MEDLKLLMQHQFLNYASYVILDRAIPNVVDGLKPVQRRILHTLYQMDDGKLHKVANVVGQTMAYHPHGDAPISEALISLSNRGYLLDQQGNFGNIFTGDPAAAARYIETRLSTLAQETLFNPDLTSYVPTYDSRNKEPVCLPAKIPVLLLQGAEGIAVGMATKILPHNFVELLEAEIAILEGRDFVVFPDFPTAGFVDASQYDQGRGKVKVRAKLEMRDPKTIVITEICYGTTTESLIRSIDEAAKRGKIRIESISDYTAEKVEIEIKLPRGQYAESLRDALFAYTECEVAITSQLVVIRDNLPWDATVNEILHLNVEYLQGCLRRELEIEHERLLEKVFQKTLEQIFIGNRLYKKIENISEYDKIHAAIEESLVPYHKELSRVPIYEDREHLLSIPIRRISRFDLNKNEEEVAEIRNRLEQVDKDLKGLKKYTIGYLKGLIKKYGKEFPRKTQIQALGEVDLRAMETRTVTVGFDPKTGFIGTTVTSDNNFQCTNFDKLLVMFKDGTYKVINLPEKLFLHNDNTVVYVGVADKKTVVSIVAKDPKTKYCYAKRFIVEKFILDKTYRFLDEEVSLEYLTTQPNVIIELQLVPKPKQKVSKIECSFVDIPIKGVSARGIRVSNKEVKKIKALKQAAAVEKGGG